VKKEHPKYAKPLRVSAARASGEERGIDGRGETNFHQVNLAGIKAARGKSGKVIERIGPRREETENEEASA